MILRLIMMLLTRIVSRRNFLRTDESMKPMFLTCLFLFMVSSNAQNGQTGWFCYFNTQHSCRGDPQQWIAMTQTIMEGMTNITNGYVLANINGSSNSNQDAVLLVNHDFLSNRGTIYIRYRSETAEPRNVEGTLSITACKSQPEPIFTVGHRNCSDWCEDVITYTCEGRSDVEVVFTATKGSNRTEIAIDYISITPTPDWEFSSRDDYNQSKIEQTDTDSGYWMSHGLGDNALFQAIFYQQDKGDTAVFSVKHQFTSPCGDLQLRLRRTLKADDVFLNVSSCFKNETILSVSSLMKKTTSLIQYNCESTDEVFFTFTAIRGQNESSIDIDLIRIFEGDVSIPALTMMTTTRATTTTTMKTDSDDQNVGITENPAGAEATTSLANDMTETTTLGNSSNDTADSTTYRIVIPIVIPVVIFPLIIFVIVGVARCVFLRRRRKPESSSLIVPRTNSQNVYTNPAFLSKPSTPGESHQPDLLDGLNVAPIVVSQETQSSRSEAPEVASGSTEAVLQDGHRYYSIHGAPGGGGDGDPDSHEYSLPFETHSNPSKAKPGQSRGSRNIASNIASDGYTSLRRNDESGNHDYSLPFKADNGYTSIKPRALSKGKHNPVSDDASPGYTSLKRSDDFDGPNYSLINTPPNDSSGVKPPSKSNGMDQVAIDECPQQKSSSDPALDRTSLTKTKGGVRDSINYHDYYSWEQDQSHDYALLDKKQTQDNSVPSDQAVSSDREYGRLGTPSSPAVLHDDDDYNYLTHKDHHRVVDKIRPGNHGTLNDLHSPELFNDNVYNTLNDGGAPSRHYDGRQEMDRDYESVDLTSGSAELPETNDTPYGSMAEHDGDSLLDGDYEEPLHPNITKDEDSVDEKTDRGAADQDVKEQIGTVGQQGAGDYQSLRSDKNVSKNHNDGAGSNGDGLSGEGAQHVPHITKDPETQQIPLDRDLDAYGPKSDSFDRISPLYHSIKIGKK